MTWTDWDKALWALTMWREARGEGREGMLAVGCVIRNRIGKTKSITDGIAVMEKKWQFSSLTAPGDPMLVQWPTLGDPLFGQSMEIVDSLVDWTQPDITDGATHYFNPHVVLPTWAATMTKIKSIGNHDFYK